jgi:hypothetical protein
MKEAANLYSDAPVIRIDLSASSLHQRCLRPRPRKAK